MSDLAHSPDAHSHDDHSHDDHKSHTGLYLTVTVTLCVLTLCSFLTTSDMWKFSDVAARIFMMAVSCCKAMLVILFFMHLKYEANWKYVLTIPAAMMSLFLVLMLVPDVGLRTRRYAEERLLNAADPTTDHHDAHGGSIEGDHTQGEHVEH